MVVLEPPQLSQRPNSSRHLRIIHWLFPSSQLSAAAPAAACIGTAFPAARPLAPRAALPAAALPGLSGLPPRPHLGSLPPAMPATLFRCPLAAACIAVAASWPLGDPAAGPAGCGAAVPLNQRVVAAQEDVVLQLFLHSAGAAGAAGPSGLSRVWLIQAQQAQQGGA